jgi:hypothetical protein
LRKKLLLNLGFRFPDENKNRTDWSSTLTVKCGWGKAWDPPTVPGIIKKIRKIF